MAIITTHNHLDAYTALDKRTDKNVSIEPVDVQVIENKVSLLPLIILAGIVIGFVGWTVDMVSPSSPTEPIVVHRST